MGLFSSGLIRCCLAIFVAGFIFFPNVAVLAADSHTSEHKAPRENKAGEVETTAFKGLFGSLDSEFTLSAGIRSENLNWSIARRSSGGAPNILSELSWSDVDSYQLSLTNRSHIKKKYYFRGAFNYAWIDDGRVRDSDYGEDFRSAEWSRSISQTNGDQVWDISVGGGYAFHFMQDRLTVAPLLGFSYHKQNLRIKNGKQALSEPNPFSAAPEDQPPGIGPLSSQLNSTYFARWMGPWLGCDLRYQLKERSQKLPPIRLGLSLEIHWADYLGEGNWNLRSDLRHPKSFEHEARGNGISLTCECLIALAAHWDLALTYNLQEWSTTRGSDRKFLAEGGTLDTRLNKVEWESTSFMVGAVYRF